LTPSSRRSSRPSGKVLRPVHANAGLSAEYKRRITALIDELHNSVRYWLGSAYRAKSPELAQDASPAETMRAAIRKLTRRWTERFYTAAKDLGAWFTKSVSQRSDAVLKKILKDAGISVDFQMTRAQNDVIRGTLNAQVGLIKSIPQHFLGQVEQAVMRSVQTGRDIGGLTKEIQAIAGVSKRRAAFIATSQNQMATASMTRARQIETGITTAVWRHSNAGKVPRRTHLAMNGREYDVAKGMWDSAENRHVLPGELIRCFPAHTKIRLSERPVRLWRSFFNGKMVDVQIGADLLQGTFNHPVLTGKGWVSLNELQCGDKVVCMREDRSGMVHHHEDDYKTSIGHLFDALWPHGSKVSRKGTCFDFYGEVPQGDVDEVVVADNDLLAYIEASADQNVGNLSFSEPDAMSGLRVGRGVDHVPAPGLASLVDDGLPFGSGSFGKPLQVGVATVAHDPASDQNGSNIRGGMSRSAQLLCDSGGAHAGLVKGDDTVRHRLPIYPLVESEPDSSELFAEFVRVAADRSCGIFEFGSALYEFRSVTNKRIWDYSGHVFTMQTNTGHYSVSDARVQAKNCRCVSLSVVKGFSL